MTKTRPAYVTLSYVNNSVVLGSGYSRKSKKEALRIANERIKDPHQTFVIDLTQQDPKVLENLCHFNFTLWGIPDHLQYSLMIDVCKMIVSLLKRKSHEGAI